VSSSVGLKSRVRVRRKFPAALAEAEEARFEKTGSFQDRLQSVHPGRTTRNDPEGIEVQGGSSWNPTRGPELMEIPFHKSTLTDLVLGMIPRSKSRGKKASAQEQVGKLEREYGRVDSRGRSFEDDYGNSSYPDFRGYELGDARYNSFARIQGPSVRARTFDPRCLRRVR